MRWRLWQDFSAAVSLGASDSTPFEMALTLPVRVPHIQVRAIARHGDRRGIAFAIRDFEIFPDSRQTVRGHVLSEDGRAAQGVSLRARFHGLQAEFFDFQTPLVAIPDLAGRLPARVGSVTA